MSSESSPELIPEVGHVLFIDIVGYSKLLINEQTELLEHLKVMVRGSEQIRLGESKGKLIRLATNLLINLVFWVLWLGTSYLLFFWKPQEKPSISR